MKKAITIAMIFTVITAICTYTPDTQQAAAQVEQRKKLIVGGEAFGIRMFSDGVLVIEVEEKLYGTDIPSPAVLAGIEVNDIIQAADGISLESNEHFTEIIRSSNGKAVRLIINRGGKTVETYLTPKPDSQGIPRAGLWIKDSAAGIGTITYYDAENSVFGALGHGICEAQTGTVIPLSYGEIEKASISDITKSESGKVGSLNGYFEGETIGYAHLNCDCGIFGAFSAQADGEVLEIATKSEVKTGEAQIYCTLQGHEKKCYDIKIRRLSKGNEDTMVIEITDPELLDITGGIVQGMSGSPIVQDNKLVGAVTHVLINSPTLGYGIFIEDMLDAAG